VLLQPPPPPSAPAAATAFVVDWATAAQAFPFYRAPWETRPAQEFPRETRVRPAPLTAAPLRVVVQRQFWSGPVSDFFLYLGFIALGGGSGTAHGPGSWLESRLEVGPGLAPALFNPVVQDRHFSHWEYPPLRARILEASERGGPPR